MRTLVVVVVDKVGEAVTVTGEVTTYITRQLKPRRLILWIIATTEHDKGQAITVRDGLSVPSSFRSGLAHTGAMALQDHADEGGRCRPIAALFSTLLAGRRTRRGLRPPALVCEWGVLRHKVWVEPSVEAAACRLAER